ncbi:FBD-associated F-box protein At3g52670-like [Salvia miltiorrhiza]|uniref:FBD-associated F-box protein At3g52670-like n=1 Tax=Salvia miltiorrhiza TaxID=226208 RepID=UPI0025ABEB2C|nr:FBD-associated F-box protein At3g52670-like [Salvia miltiorrhiza]
MGAKFRRNKCCKRLDGVVDRISALPDDIIIAILSHLSLREAAATSVLAPRWSDLWRHTPNLDFKLSAKSAVTRWLEFVFLRSVERLEWDFQCEDASDQIVLGEVLRESGICWGCRNLTIFTSLKSLCLKHLRVSGEDIKLFLRELPSLELLSICYANLTSHVEVCGATLALKHLEILHCKGGADISVSAPNLTWLCVDDISTLVLPLNVPKLVGAFFTYTSSASIDNVPHLISAISCCKYQLKTLNLTIRYPKWLFSNAIKCFIIGISLSSRIRIRG